MLNPGRRLRVGVSLAINTFVPLWIVMHKTAMPADYDVLLINSDYLGDKCCASEDLLRELALAVGYKEVHRIPSINVSAIKNPLVKLIRRTQLQRSAKRELNRIFKVGNREVTFANTQLFCDQPIHFPTQIARAFFRNAEHILVPHGIQLFTESCGNWIRAFKAKRQSVPKRVNDFFCNQLSGFHVPSPGDWYWDREITLNKILGIGRVREQVYWDSGDMEVLFSGLPKGVRTSIESQVEKHLRHNRLTLLLPLGLTTDNYQSVLVWFETVLFSRPDLMENEILLKPHPAQGESESTTQFAAELSSRIGKQVHYLPCLDGLPLELVLSKLNIGKAVGCASGSLYVVNKLNGITPMVLRQSLAEIAQIASDSHKAAQSLADDLFSYCEVV